MFPLFFFCPTFWSHLALMHISSGNDCTEFISSVSRGSLLQIVLVKRHSSRLRHKSIFRNVLKNAFEANFSSESPCWLAPNCSPQQEICKGKQFLAWIHSQRDSYSFVFFNNGFTVHSSLKFADFRYLQFLLCFSAFTHLGSTKMKTSEIPISQWSVTLLIAVSTKNMY